MCSINSIDEFLASDDFIEAAPDVLKSELSERIDELLARKGSTNKGREECLATYSRIVSAHLCADVLYGRSSEIVSAITKSIKSETSEKETILALKALSLTAITVRDDHLYENVSTQLKRTISDSQSLKTKAAAIGCLGDCLTFGGAGEDEIIDQMTFLLEIVSSDGHFIDAPDDADTVVAALQTYGFLATQVPDLEAESEDAIEAFSEQLESASPEVQIAAGEDIALFYEKAYRLEDAGVDSDSDSDSDDESAEPSNTTNTSEEEESSQRYSPYHATHTLLTTVTSLASLSTKKLSRKSRKTLHQTFTAIQATLENPTEGLQWNNRSHMTIRIHQEGEMYINRWWKLMRLNALRRLLGGGFVNHYYEGNGKMLELLPVLIDRKYGSGGGEGEKKGEKRKYKDQSYSPRSLGLMTGED